MNIPKDCRYAKSHEWVRLEGSEVRIGITDFAQSGLGDIVFVELPKAGVRLVQTEQFGTVEAVKMLSELYSPVTGEVLESNSAVVEDTTLVNRSPYADGWMIRAKISNPSELDNLLGPEEYVAWVAEEEARH